MSKGNYRNNGDERKGELYKACNVLEIPEQNITVLRWVKTNIWVIWPKIDFLQIKSVSKIFDLICNKNFDSVDA